MKLAKWHTIKCWSPGCTLLMHPGKVEENGPSPWAPPTHAGNPDEALGF